MKIVTVGVLICLIQEKSCFVFVPQMVIIMRLQPGSSLYMYY